MKKSFYRTLGVAGLLASAAGLAAAEECGEISIAEMNWASAELMANVDAIILEEGYGCEVELVPGATQTTFASMSEKQQPDVAPELWVNGIMNPLQAAVAENRVQVLNEGPITGLGEGWWVSKSFREAHPELDTVEKILEHPDLFPSVEDASKGAFMGCPAGWSCQLSNANLFRAFDMEAKGWVLIDPGSAAGLDGAIAKASERNEPWFGYYWSPTAVIGKYKLQKLDWETPWAGNENWETCIAKPEQECLDPQKTSYSASAVNSVVATEFAEKGGAAVDYIKARVFPGEAMNEMLVFMTDNQASGEDAAYEFLATMEDVWTKWVPEDVAAKVKKGL